MPKAPTGALRIVALLVGLHSCVLGIVILFLPLEFSRFAGFDPCDSPFFPSQTGIFLLALGICYLLAVRDRALIPVILVSKSLAVIFLVVHAAFLGGPPILWAVAAGDALMLFATLVAMRHERITLRHAGALTPRPSS